ncbi:hypothetical protein PAAG_01776 [Paracoccidioides lutzii Pb01]|uniref:Uncharacterized protein n=1 Tax=Paracoccidioides lutzii (strain ATCC MYA-826 / Pb01) TaxID=502779 RepID=C1GTD1_PARBA|nr:hypothetical protein PAAG_01776 [Paracoccidioides lutzii Pb01]EEH39314.1 hypothetical protein PAAG_01776 [Paracoccidioides lutzii Pb01]
MAPVSGVSLASEVRGKKRHAAEELEGEQRLAKKFGLLHIGRIGQSYLPSILDDACTIKETPTSGFGAEQPKLPAAVAAAATNESMQIDETKDRIYIHDLESEFAKIEAEENNVAILPEIEKKLMSVPKSLLSTKPPARNELVLYRLPSSLSVPEPQDSVRKAIIEARERAREKAIADQREKEKVEGEGEEKIITQHFLSHEMNGSLMDLLPPSSSALLPSPESLDLNSQDDPDAMDIDSA